MEYTRTNGRHALPRIQPCSMLAFWVGMLEVEAVGDLEAARHIFGVEPTSAEVAEFVRRDFVQLVAQAANTLIADDALQTCTRRASSTRRAARQAAHFTAVTDISSAAQEALRAQREGHC